MKSLNKSIGILMLFAILLTIGFPCGIVGIVMGATKGMTWLLVIGIVFVVLGFYGAPIAWIKYGERKSLKSVLYSVCDEKIFAVNDLATQLNTNKKDIVGKINTLIEKRYLTGYIFKNQEVLEPNYKKNAQGQNKCPNCGAIMKGDGEECPYCGYKKSI